MVNTTKISPELKVSTEAMGTGDMSIDASFDLGNVAEIVAQSVGENGAVGGDDKNTSQQNIKSTGFDFSIASRISKLLFNSTSKEVALPEVGIQKAQIRKSVERQTKSLMKKIDQIQNARNFSADKLEQVVEQIRYLQRILEEIVTAMKDRIESLYKKIVLEKSV